MRKKRRILFFAKQPVRYALFRPIHEKLNQDPHIEVFFCGKWYGQRDAGPLFSVLGLEREKLISTSWARYKAFDMYISPGFNLVGRRARVKVQIFHGVSFKNYAISPRALDYDKLFLVGPYMKRRFIEQGILCHDDSRMEMIGMPKVDCLVDGTLSREEIRERLALNPNLPTVLYAPTWSEESSLYLMGEELIKTVGQMEVNLLVKLHDNCYDQRKNSINWGEKLEGLMRPNVRHIRDYDICPYLYVSDMLISDASSVSNEFLLLDRPIIFVDVPRKWEKIKHRLDLDTWGRKVGTTVSTIPELKKALGDAIEHPERQSEIRRQAARDIFYEPGGATTRAVEKIYQLLELEPLELTKREQPQTPF